MIKSAEDFDSLLKENLEIYKTLEIQYLNLRKEYWEALDRIEELETKLKESGVLID